MHKNEIKMQPARWLGSHVVGIQSATTVVAPLLTDADVQRLGPDIDIWDAWPLQEIDGTPAVLADGSTLWMALGSPHFADPDERHGHARITLLQRKGEEWKNLGPAMPDGFSPGSREWSGSAILQEDGHEVRLYFTATGRRGEATTSFEQRLFVATATLETEGARPQLTHWRDCAEAVKRDPRHYMASDSGTGAIGTIKAFRDPAFFRDPKDGANYLLFAGSAANSGSQYNGVIGAAVASDAALSDWTILPPLVSADGLNNELERPHIIYHAGLYYLFWSTQSHVFDPSGPVGPTGLYGMVSDRIDGEWRPLNGTALVFANPPEAPRQAYSWLVMPDLRVTSFVDDWGSAQDAQERKFGATFAPFLTLELDGARARLCS